jgi:hypothetical protein
LLGSGGISGFGNETNLSPLEWLAGPVQNFGWQRVTRSEKIVEAQKRLNVHGGLNFYNITCFRRFACHQNCGQAVV